MLPFSFIGMGEPVQPEDAGFSDAQEHSLKAFDWRLCTVELGNVRIKERFLVSNVTCPLLASGKLHKAGWGTVNEDNGPVFVHGTEKRIPCWYRHNGLMASAQIRVIAKHDNDERRAHEESGGQVQQDKSAVRQDKSAVRQDKPVP